MYKGIFTIKRVWTAVCTETRELRNFLASFNSYSVSNPV